MDWLDALILGIVQGLTEYLPVSSSGHLQIGHELLGLKTEGSLTFDIVVHVATVLSTLVILWKEVVWIFRGLLDKPLPSAAVEHNTSWWNRINDQQRYALLIIISMIPIGIVGVFFKDSIEELFSSIKVVGWCELLTAALLAMTFFYKPNEREKLTPMDALIIGLAQACAVLPGLSRSGSTIGTGLLLGCKKETLAQFSFLMVIPPILGEALLDFKHIFAPSAEYLAEQIHDEAVNLLNRIKTKDYSGFYSETPYVICSPVYVCEMPRFLASFLRNVTFKGSREVYFIFTSGGYAGSAGLLARRMFRKKNMIYKGCAELKMPRNYLVNETYPELGRDEIRSRIIQSFKDMIPVSETIRNRAFLRSRHVWFFETLITLPFNPVWCRVRQPVKDFYAKDSCVSCGKCEKLCPLNIIQMEDGKPVWKGRSCAHCMSCIQNCPVEAIEYGNVTQEKARYQFSRYKEIPTSDNPEQ